VEAVDVIEPESPGDDDEHAAARSAAAAAHVTDEGRAERNRVRT
jgi:hypothetical protein